MNYACPICLRDDLKVRMEIGSVKVCHCPHCEKTIHLHVFGSRSRTEQFRQELQAKLASGLDIHPSRHKS